MNRADFLRLVGGGEGAEYTPVAGLLHSGQGFAGYYNAQVNEGMETTCVLVNARVVDMSSEDHGTGQPRITDFRDFLEEIVQQAYQSDDAPEMPRDDIYGKSIPLAAIPLDEIAVLYPVGQIGRMMQELETSSDAVPSFLDFTNKSVVLKVLRTKLW